MKSIHLAAAIALGLSASAFAAGGHEHSHEHAALHGGIVTEVKHVDYELVATAEQIQLHLRDHGQAIDVAGAAARLTILSGGAKQEVELKPDGAKLAASGSFKLAGAKVVAVVSRPGKAPATVRFALK